MNERGQDFELLQRFARQGAQSAFADLVRCHLDLVYATALRKLEDPGAAQEVAQDVFSTLARKAWRFAPDDSLPAWLHKTTLLEAKSWLRGELRRRRREQTAAELGTTMNTPDEQPALRALVPLLDEALLSLREKDRTALLLRFYETQSLRDVGTAFGVGEDAAQKRVQGALEKLSQFFQRHGFKTATVVAITATLQQTASSATTATANHVVNAALQTAPPALAGVTALLARLASLSKPQVAALCVALAGVPMTWEWKQSRAAGMEASALQSQLSVLQIEREQSTVEVERMRVELARLEQTRLDSVLDQSREEEALRRLANLKLRSRGLLTADNYRWPDDLPFVRVPKSALSAIKVAGGPNTPERLAAKVNRFLDLTPQERETTGQGFSNYFAGIDRLLETSLYETNQATNLKLPPGAESKVFVLLPLGGKIRAALDQLCADLETALGSERWAMVKPERFEFTHYEQVRLLGYTQYAWDQTQEVAINLFLNADREPMLSWAMSGGAGSSPVPLRFFLAGGLPRTSPTSSPIPTLNWQGPPALVERVKKWVAAEAALRLGTPGTK